MTVSIRVFAVSVVTLLLLTVATLRAGEVTTFTWHSGVASLAATTISPLTAPNNDDVAGVSPNSIFVTQKDYKAVGPVDITFNVINSGGVSEYTVTEGVYNGTGLNWNGYHIELGRGHGLGFVKSLPGDGLDFDSPVFNSPLVFDPAPGFFSRRQRRLRMTFTPLVASCPTVVLPDTFASISTCQTASPRSPSGSRRLPSPSHRHGCSPAWAQRV